jgi:hypothetical protein
MKEMIRVNVSLEEYHYRAYKAIAQSIGVSQVGTAIRIVLQRHAERYIREHSEELKMGFIQQEILFQDEQNRQADTESIVREATEGIEKRNQRRKAKGRRVKRKNLP